mgnify:CR=1 FL=1
MKKFSRNVGEGLAPPAGSQLWILHAAAGRCAPHTFPSGKVPPKGADEGRGALKHSLACTSKRNCSPTLISLLRFAPQPASPRGSQGALCKSALRQRNDTAYQREGQAPPLRYDEIITSSLFTLTSYLSRPSPTLRRILKRIPPTTSLLFPLKPCIIGRDQIVLGVGVWR